MSVEILLTSLETASSLGVVFLLDTIIFLVLDVSVTGKALLFYNCVKNMNGIIIATMVSIFYWPKQFKKGPKYGRNRKVGRRDINCSFSSYNKT